MPWKDARRWSRSPSDVQHQVHDALLDPGMTSEIFLTSVIRTSTSLPVRWDICLALPEVPGTSEPQPDYIAHVKARPPDFVLVSVEPAATTAGRDGCSAARPDVRITSEMCL